MRTFTRRAPLFLALIVGALALSPTTQPSAQSVAGRLDGTFGAGGVVATDVSGGDDEAAAVLIQPDGKICVAGRDGAFSSTFAVVRYLADGRLDAGFGDGGKVRISILGAFSYATAIARSRDGALIVGGDVLLNDGSRQLALVRLSADGLLDPSFGKVGKVVGPLEDRFSSFSTHLQKVAVQPDGKLLVAGSFVGEFTSFPFLYRLQADGSLDTSFGGNGRAFFGNGDDLLIQPDGKIVTAGHGFLSRQNPDGTPDQSFGNRGSIDTDAQLAALGLFATSPAIAVTADGKVVLASSSSHLPNLSEDDFTLIRFNVDGSPDKSFGTNGLTLINVARNDRVKALLAQPDGKVLLAGYVGVNDPGTHLPVQAHVALLRFNADGSLDEGFKADPLPADPLGFGVANALALQDDGRILIAGGIRNSGGEDMLVARYESGLRIPPPPVPDFSLTAEPTTVSGARGSKVSFKVIVQFTVALPNVFSTQDPELSPLKVQYVGFQGTLDGLTLTQTYTLKIKGKAKAGTYPLVFAATDSAGHKHSTTLTLIIT